MTIPESAKHQLVGWVATLGGVVAGGLLLWIGGNVQELLKTQAVQSERVQAVAIQQLQNTRALDATTAGFRELTLRMQRVEDSIERDRDERREEEQ